ncbi:murein biosynthesis integral membrane protein MurJ [Paradesulfitobacterium ferrireducens]|uniref:murein biosynthesis integral membrane protein MurJ n=1 Tax=Paradesulfitobacterium ferrireducens TaxID=2816476 RepID=UPI001A8D88A7|nr:murein biosynthesis integral membrane protein MurJ [Paradesulfitobacterium ferrireducens]
MSISRSVARAAGFLMIANLLSRVLGFLRESLIANYFGKSGATDAYIAAFNLPDLIYWLLVGGVLSAAFIPVLSEYLAKEKEEEAWRIVSSVVNILFLSISVLIIMGLIFTPAFVKIQVPGFNRENLALATGLTRILLIQPLLLAMSGLTMGVLNSYKIFWPSALGTVLYNVSIIVFGIIFSDPSRPGSISGFAFGVVVGAAVNFAVQIPALRKIGIKYYPLIDWQHPGVRKIAALALPIVISYTINQLQVIVSSNLASSLSQGSITAIQWSYRLYLLPVGIFALAVAVASFPTLSEEAALKNWQRFKEINSSAVRMIILLTVPVSVGMIVLRYPLLQVLFEHGAFTAADTAATAVPLLFFALGIFAQAVIQVLPRAFYALQDTWTPVLVGILSMAVNIGAMFLLLKPLVQGGVALATSISAFLNMFILFYLLRKRLGGIDGRRILSAWIRTAVASIVMGIVITGWSAFLTGLIGVSKLSALVVLLSGTGLGVLVFAGAARLLGLEEMSQAAGLVRKRFGR